MADPPKRRDRICAHRCRFPPFAQISRNDPERPFVIAVYVDENGRYVVPECFPALPREDFERLLADVNDTNNFASFVSSVRRGFVALAEAGL